MQYFEEKVPVMHTGAYHHKNSTAYHNGKNHQG
jgi:hypothetical protein